MNYTSRFYLAAFACIGISATGLAKAPEWTFGLELNGNTISLESRPCYEDNTKSMMAISLYGRIDGAVLSVAASCDCGETIKINDTAAYSAESFSRLMQESLDTDLKSYMCLPAE
jgi:hypothetical protein